MLIVRSALAVVAMVAMSVSSAASACGKFEGRLILEDVATNYPDHGAFDPGHTEFQLLSEYTFIGCDGTRYTIPTHREVGGEKVPTIVNGASIPKAIWSVVGGPWSGKYRNAAVIHDFMTEINFEDSDTTNRIFYDAMISNDVPEWKASLMYFAAVKAGPQWVRGAAFSSIPSGQSVSVEELEKLGEELKKHPLSPEELEALAIEN